MTMTLTSTAFAHGEEIPEKYTCDGDDIALPLEWSDVPEGTHSFTLIVDDPDAPIGTWVHWVLYNIPFTETGLPEGVTSADLPPGTLEGVNGWGRTGYGGPCPPRGRHRYFHKLYALDTTLPDLEAPKKKDLEAAMEGHILATAQLMGTYSR